MNSRPTSSKVLLVLDGRGAADGGRLVPVRRYRLARLLPEYRASMRKSPASRRA